MGLPTGLRPMGVGEDLFERVIDGAMADHCHKTNPRLASRDDYRAMLTDLPGLDPVVVPLTAFVALFSIGIAWFKDIPDTKGDLEYRFGTLAVQMGRGAALWLGTVVVVMGYLAVIIPVLFGLLPNSFFFFAAFALPLFLFLLMAAQVNVKDDREVKRFYYFFWGLFFLAYVLYPLGLILT